jgi:hypothetical protein
MSESVFDILDDEVRTREDQAVVAEQNMLAGIYEGKLPSAFDKYFPKSTPKQVVNLVRLAWDDLATQVGRLPDFRADPRDSTKAAGDAAGMLERIAHFYMRKAAPRGELFLWELAWWLVGIGRAVAIVTPNTEDKHPEFQIRDPRTCFPKAAKTSGTQIVELADIIFKYELDEKEMMERGLKVKPRQPGSERGAKAFSGTVIEFIDRDQWIVASDGGTVQRTEHGLGIVPGWVFQTFSPDKTAGLSQFQDQITFMVAISRMLSQKLRYADRLAHPITWVKGYEGTVTIGPDVLNKLSPQGEMGQLSSPTQLQVDRDIELLTRFSRILNRNPEVRQGEIQSRGSYTSAKTLEQLSEAIDTVVGRMWDYVSVGSESLMAAAFAMDEKLWPNMEKSITGVVKGTRFNVTYTPSKDIAGARKINVDYGFGVGGYQGFLQQLQAKDSGLQSQRGALEQMPGVSDVEAKLREIELEQMDAAIQRNFMAQAEAGQLDVLLWAKLRKELAKGSKSIAQIIEKYQEELQAQAQAAIEQGGADALTAPPIDEAPIAEESLPGLPPAALVG